MRSAHDSLTSIAFYIGISPVAAAHLSINKLYSELFVSDEDEYEFQTDKLIQDVQLHTANIEHLKPTKTPLELDIINIFKEHLQTFEIDIFTEGNLVGMLSAWLSIGAISMDTWHELDELRSNRNWKYVPEKSRKQGKQR